MKLAFKNWKELDLNKAEFYCHYCNCSDYTIKTDSDEVQFYVEAKCCQSKFSIDYLFLHLTPTYEHTR